MLKLSIIVPIYNVEKYLRKCLDSLMAQTYRNLEIILIDDGSPDRCGTICDEYKERDPRFVVIHKSNGGLSTAWNCGLDQATGDYLTFVDSDDWVDTDYFERILKFIGDKEFDLFMAHGHIIETPDGGHHEVHTFDQPFIAQERNEKNNLLVRTLVRTRAVNGELYQNLGVVWDKIYRTAFIRDHGFRFTSSLVTRCSWIDSLFVFQAIDQADIILGGNVIGYHYRVVNFSQTKKYNPYLPTAYEAYFDELNSYIQNNVLIDKAVGGGNFNRRLRQAIQQKTFISLSDCMQWCWFHPKNPKDKNALAVEIYQVKKKNCYYEAIHCPDNKFILKKYLLLKLVCRIPGVWPLELLAKADKIRRKMKQVY